ncbi:GH39 family glycosyl hydrolase [Hymenobacter cheonanensis]|uniref:GH39 family glycosyl hydrolase n=1 Tax=Hymenobacter sp. CA2-7 TaxID=3063993 RepID=UPI002713A792|nr:beta-xylosidase [Hymenobacter sp. CA2-7]MDO7886874.1 beta-xylosidase [Hymenobacter sp. CA2-7]
MRHISFSAFSRRLLTVAASLPLAAQAQTAPAPTVITVDVAKPLGPMPPVWAYFGYDEPNYTYMPDGQKLLTELAALSPVPVYVRAHNLLTTGDGTAALKWGSTNVYTEDKNGRAVYDWKIVDQIFDAYIKRGMKPIAQIGFMPEAMSTHPVPYRHYWKPGDNYNDIYTGWAYPPKDYKKWGELVYQWVKHNVARYGAAEVKTWRWELWNEPNIGYWKGTPEEYNQLYDYTEAAVHRALPAAILGGPETTGPGWDKAAAYLRGFLQHCVSGKNYVTGRTGTRLDYISFHAKGAPKLVDGHVRMNMGTQFGDIEEGFKIVASFPTLRQLPIILGENDPEGCAACGVQTNPENAYRNGTMYSSYTAAAYARLYELASQYQVNLEGAVSWSFEFENQPWFAGFRDLATNGVDKPVLNVFRMLGMMRGPRVAVTSPGALTVADIRAQAQSQRADISALATADAHSATVLVWNYHNDALPAPPAEVELTLQGLATEKAQLQHYRIDNEHSNAYTAWQALGSPQQVSATQRASLEQAGQLAQLTAPASVSLQNGRTVLHFTLPRHGVSLLRLAW